MVSDTGFYFYGPNVGGTPIPIPHPSYFQFNNDGTGSSVANQDPLAIVWHFDYDIQRDTLIKLFYHAQTVNNVSYQAATDSVVIVKLNGNNLSLGIYEYGLLTERAHFIKPTPSTPPDL
jgi:hypothetical protein